MSGMENREKSFEAKFAHEEKLSFDLEARCSKIFGLYIAEQLGLKDQEAQTYAREAVESNLDEPGFEDLLRKVKADLVANNIEISEHRLKLELDNALQEAKKQLNAKN